MVNEMNSIFTYSFLIQVFSASIDFCGCAFIAIFYRESNVIHFVLILALTFIRLYLFCRLGEDLLDKVSKKKLDK